MEGTKNFLQLRNKWNCSSTAVFSVIFCIGFGLGVFFAFNYENAFLILLSNLQFSYASFVGMCVCVFAPLFLSLVSVLFSCPVILFPICFFKAFCFAYCSFSCFLFFGNAGWLIRFLLLFSDTFSILPLLWFCLRHIDGSLSLVRRDFIICIVFLLSIFSVDYLLVSPFLMLLIDY